MEIKKEVFGKLDRIVKPGAILATNTSYLDVNDIAEITKRPNDVIGLHFFSPANVMKLLEIVRGAKTDKDVIATSMSLGKSIAKVPVLVGVCNGFVGNRMLAARRIQAMDLISQGAMPWDVDRVLEDFGMPMGPFAMGDLAGSTSAGTRRARTDACCATGSSAGRAVRRPRGLLRTTKRRVSAASTGRAGARGEFAKKSGQEQRKTAIRRILERCLYAWSTRVRRSSKRASSSARQRHRRSLGQRLRLAGLPGRPMFWPQRGTPDVVESLKGYQRDSATAGAAGLRASSPSRARRSSLRRAAHRFEETY